MSPVKKTTRKAKSKKTSARRKATTKKAAPKARATKKKVASKTTAAKGKKAAPRAARAPKTKRAAVAPVAEPAEKKAAVRKVAAPPPPPPPPDAHPKLGVKHTCFRCGAKFYDLFRPEPLCPKCGADQREAPKVDPKRKLQPPPKSIRKGVMVPLLDDEDDETLYEDLDDSVLDLEPAGAELDDPAADLDDDSDL